MVKAMENFGQCLILWRILGWHRNRI